MAGLKEVPTDELLSFHDFPTTHTTNINTQYTGAQLNVDTTQQNMNIYNDFPEKVDEEKAFLKIDEDSAPISTKSIWSIEFYQQFFDVDTIDVKERIIGSFFPKKDSTFKREVKVRPDLYGPFWICVTLIFTIAISGNIANYFQHVNSDFRWKYDFHLVSYAATAIFIYITLVPLSLWGLLKWSVDKEGLGDAAPNALELVCIYGYSLFIYIPTSVLWTIQVGWLQWLLVGLAALLSGSVLLFTLNPALKSSKFRLVLTVAIISCHLLLAAGFMLYFFHVPAIAVQGKIDNATVANIHTNDTVKH